MKNYCMETEKYLIRYLYTNYVNWLQENYILHQNKYS